MSGILRNLMCLCFVGLMVGSLWFFAATATVPSIPPWRDQDQKQLVKESAQLQHTAAINAELNGNCDDYDDAYDDATTAAVSFDEDDDGHYVRRT